MFLLWILSSCTSSKTDEAVAYSPERFAETVLTTLQGEKVSGLQLLEDSLQVFVFLSPECPLCQKYIAEIRRQATDFAGSVNYFAVFPGKWYSKEKISEFMQQYQLEIPALLDPAYKLTHLFDATITPEVFVLDPAAKVIYKGAIDNWAYEVGRTRPTATAFYLRDAIDAKLVGQPITNPKTKAVGCLIE